jgi:hypothetical protein
MPADYRGYTGIWQTNGKPFSPVTPRAWAVKAQARE